MPEAQVFGFCENLKKKKNTKQRYEHILVPCKTGFREIMNNFMDNFMKYCNLEQTVSSCF